MMLIRTVKKHNVTALKFYASTVVVRINLRLYFLIHNSNNKLLAFNDVKYCSAEGSVLKTKARRRVAAEREGRRRSLAY